MNDYEYADYERQQLLNDMNSERQEKKAEAARLLEGVAALQQDGQQETFNRKYAQKSKKYWEKAQKEGLTPDVLQRIYAKFPEAFDRVMDLSFKQGNRVLKDYQAMLEGGQSLPQPRGNPQPATGRQPASKPASLEEGREKVSRGGHLNEQEQMDILAAVLGPDFKV